MKKWLFLVTLLLSLGGCQNKPEEKASADDALEVEIVADKSAADTNGLPLVLTPQLSEAYDEDLQYHWTIENYKDYENLIGFVIPENGPQREILNAGEPVEFGLFAEVMWVEGAEIEFKIHLQVTEKDSSQIVASDDIIIENNGGMFEVK